MPEVKVIADDGKLKCNYWKIECNILYWKQEVAGELMHYIYDCISFE
jgi:hypothetical protein